MKAFITGGCRNGKSGYAQELSCALSPSGMRFYVATMIPGDEEDLARIERHVRDREGLGFETIEAGRVCDGLPEQRALPGRPVYMIDSLTALLGNEMFHDGITDDGAEARIRGWMAEVFAMDAHVILIADDISCDTDVIPEDTDPQQPALQPFGEETMLYRNALGSLTQYAAQLCDTVIEMELGRPIFLKAPRGDAECGPAWNAENARNGAAEETGRKHESAMRIPDRTGEDMKQGYILIIGGAAQGKLEFARKTYGLTDEEICECTEEAEPDVSKRCITHLERYVLYCLRNGITPVLPEHGTGEDGSLFADGKILIADDIFRGIVPLGKETRAYREAAGRYLTKVASLAGAVKRIMCGLEL